MRAYLLGTLDDRHAVALEEKYFVDREFFGRVRNIETELIEDYLENRLSPPEKRLFERRYLEIPNLRRRVEEVRQEFPKTRPAFRVPRSIVWRLSLAGVAFSLMFAGGLAYWRAQPRGAGNSTRLPQVAQNLSVFTVRLTPGMIKGPTAQSVVIAPPSIGTVLRLALELPGRNSAADYQARLTTIAAEGGRSRIWESGILRPVPAPGGGVLTVDLASNLLRPGDYVVEVGPPQGGTVESYLFRVSTLR
jgi:hypothetical protein